MRLTKQQQDENLRAVLNGADSGPHKAYFGYVPESREEIEFLDSYDPAKYPVTMVTVDTVITRWRESDGPYGGYREVLLIKRGGFPYKGYWALPGGFMEPDETAEEAALREVTEEAGLVPWMINFSHVADAPNRDPRGRAISMVFKSQVREGAEAFAGDDAVEVKWFHFAEALTMDLAFDHNEILKKAL